MKPRALVTLLTVAVGLFAFIVLYERTSLTTPELEGRDRQLVRRFVRARVSGLVVEHANRVVEVVRDAGDGGEPGPWRVVRPVRADADQDAVESLLSTLEWTEPQRRLQSPSVADLHAFGLDAPRVRVVVRTAGESSTLELGGRGPDGTSVYARVLGDDDVYLVGNDVRDALAKSASDLRAKQLFSPAPSAIAAVTRTSPEGTVRVNVTASRLEEPLVIAASREALDSLVRALSDLRAARFVDTDTGSASTFGLSPASTRIEATNADGTQRSLLELGSPCTGHPQETYARANGGPVVCVSDDAVRPLLVPVDALSERRLLPVENQDVDRLEIADGDDALTITREGAAFRGQLTRGGHTSAFAVDETALADFLDGLRHARAQAVGPVASAPLRGRVVVRLHDGSSKTVEFGDVVEDAFPARAGEGAPTLWFAARSRTLLSPSPIHFRRGRLLDERFDRIESVAIERSGVREDVARRGNEVRVLAPTAAPADATRFAALTRALAELEAVRFVAERADPALGLAHPRFVVTFRFVAEAPLPASSHVLRIGAPFENGAAATLDDDPTVFLVAQALVDLVAEPLQASASPDAP